MNQHPKPLNDLDFRAQQADWCFFLFFKRDTRKPFFLHEKNSKAGTQILEGGHLFIKVYHFCFVFFLFLYTDERIDRETELGYTDFFKTVHGLC